MGVWLKLPSDKFFNWLLFNFLQKKKNTTVKVDIIWYRPFLVPRHLKKYSLKSDDSLTASKEEKLVYFGDNQVSKEMRNHF